MPKISVGGKVQCFNNFGYRKSFDKSGRGYQVFPSKFFLSHSAEIFCGGESFSVSIISGIKKFYASEGYVTIFDFLSKFFCPTVPKYFLVEPFCAVFQKNSGSEKV